MYLYQELLLSEGERNAEATPIGGNDEMDAADAAGADDDNAAGADDDDNADVVINSYN
jgi:hypothetical protein